MYLIRHKAIHSFQSFFLLAGVALVLLTVFLFPTEIWLLGPIMLCLSISGSAALSWRDYLKTRSQRRLFFVILIIIIWIASNPVWLNPPPFEVFGPATPEAQIEYEQKGYGVAVMPPGLLIPSTLPEKLLPNRFLIDSYQAQNVNKIAPGQVSASFQASPLAHFTHSDHFQVRRVVTPGAINILTAYFPGWYATLANQSIP